MIPEIFAFFALTIGILGRFKYVWQGNKVRKTQSSHDVSDRFIILSWVTYGIMLGHNYFQSDLVDMLFWVVGFWTSLYAMLMSWKYSSPKKSFIRWFFGAWKKGLW